MNPETTDEFDTKKTDSWERLPGLDPSLRRETAAFGSLALAGVTAILLAVSALTGFVAVRDEIITSMTSPVPGAATRSAMSGTITNSTFTDENRR